MPTGEEHSFSLSSLPTKSTSSWLANLSCVMIAAPLREREFLWHSLSQHQQNTGCCLGVGIIRVRPLLEGDQSLGELAEITTP